MLQKNTFLIQFILLKKKYYNILLFQIFILIYLLCKNTARKNGNIYFALSLYSYSSFDLFDCVQLF